MRDPLILPLVAVVAGILLGRSVGFTVWESSWPLLVFSVLVVVSRRLPHTISKALALIFVGVLAQAWHRPDAPPEIDAGSREVVVLEHLLRVVPGEESTPFAYGHYNAWPLVPDRTWSA